MLTRNNLKKLQAEKQNLDEVLCQNLDYFKQFDYYGNQRKIVCQNLSTITNGTEKFEVAMPEPIMLPILKRSRERKTKRIFAPMHVEQLEEEVKSEVPKSPSNTGSSASVSSAEINQMYLERTITFLDRAQYMATCQFESRVQHLLNRVALYSAMNSQKLHATLQQLSQNWQTRQQVHELYLQCVRLNLSFADRLERHLDYIDAQWRQSWSPQASVIQKTMATLISHAYARQQHDQTEAYDYAWAQWNPSGNEDKNQA